MQDLYKAPEAAYTTNKNESFQKCSLSDRIINKEWYNNLKEFLDCPLCRNLAYIPKQCSICGFLYCAKCSDHINFQCKKNCKQLKLMEIDSHNKTIFNKIILKCKNYLECKYSSNYFDTTQHEKECKYNKFKCPFIKCNFYGKKDEITNHSLKDCLFIEIKCPYCKKNIIRTDFNSHFENHLNNFEEEINNTFEFLQGNNFSLTKNNTVAIKELNSCWNCNIVGDKIIRKGRNYFWKIKILVIKSKIMIGVAPKNINLNEQNIYLKGYFLSCSDSRFYFLGDVKSLFIQNIQENQVVTIKVDMNNGKMFIKVDDIEYVEVINNLPINDEYIPMVCLYRKGDSVELLF